MGALGVKTTVSIFRRRPNTPKVTINDAKMSGGVEWPIDCMNEKRDERTSIINIQNEQPKTIGVLDVGLARELNNPVNSKFSSCRVSAILDVIMLKQKRHNSMTRAKVVKPMVRANHPI